jgi:hypothetical protein
LYSANNLIKITEVLSFVHLPAIMPSFLKDIHPLPLHTPLIQTRLPPLSLLLSSGNASSYGSPFADEKQAIVLFNLSIGHHYMPKKKGCKPQNDYLKWGDLCSVQS